MGRELLGRPRKILTRIRCGYQATTPTRYFYAWDLTKPAQGAIRPPSSGDDDVEWSSSPGFAFDPQLDKFVGWDGGTSVYALDPSDLSDWRGRFRYMPDYNAYILVNKTDENVFYLRL